MARVYKCLPLQEFVEGDYKLIPLRDEDKYAIMQWRNEQLDILRQKEPLTKERQEWYFQNVVDKLFEQEKPQQLLFSFFEKNVLIGYGGLVHIDWESQNAEISFITVTERNNIASQFINDWVSYLRVIKHIAEEYLVFIKIYTYAYDLRPNLYVALEKSGFIEEARLKKHIVIENESFDVLIHSCFFSPVYLRLAVSEDVEMYFKWANDELVRSNSFNTALITLDEHKKWFSAKLENSGCIMLVAHYEGKPVGQIRFDLNNDVYEIDFSLDSGYRGKGLGSKIVRQGTRAFFNLVPAAKGVVGKVKPQNIASCKSFLKAGFKEEIKNTNFEVNMYFFDK